ncbi:MAG: acriflavine resistance protein B [Planctomycetes bacterium RBG_16_64_12]|nr:MAG: acriflavine resistance protein B [Planctomycetes bacterium RBG_16_64_12]
MSDSQKTPLLTRLVEVFLRGDVAVLLVVVSLILGIAALYLTPREEEPQIVVPLADVLVSAPGLSAHEVEEKVTNRLEKLLYQIDGVEYVYSMSMPGQCIVTVRFYVGEDREDSILKLYSKLQSNIDRVPPAVAAWVVKPIEVDDVPIVNVTLWSDRPARYGDHQLRRIAEQLQHELQAISNTNRVEVIGGRARRIRVELKPAQLAARGTSALEVAQALKVSNVNVRAGQFEQQNQEFVVEAGTFIRDRQELENVVIQVSGGRPVYLRDVADVLDGPAEVESYTWIGFGPAARNPFDAKDRPAEEAGQAAGKGAGAQDGPGTDGHRPKVGPLVAGALYPAVHIAVAKRKGSNAVRVADAVERRMSELAETHLPDGVWFRITRDYGETANEKVNDLVESLVIAVITVIGLIGLVIGWRAALVVALAIPVCYSVTLFVNLVAGYTINRVTLFALILALGLLVDDPITDVENIARYFAMRIFPPRQAVLKAIQEVRPALILSILAIIASFLPLMFITGMMGPYMAPMALNVPLAVTVSMIVSFVITPWMAMVALRKVSDRAAEEPAFDLRTRPIYRISRAVLSPILNRRWIAWATLGGVALLLVAAMALPAFRVVPLKMLPYDNKNEFQIVVDMPEGATLERTEAVTRRLGRYLSALNEVRDYQLYVGLASPMDFNGMVRHYFLRAGANVADIRVNLAPKEERVQQSHTMILRIRDQLTRIARDGDPGANIKLVEVPPGPPVIATVTAEVYGPPDQGYDGLIAAARRVEKRIQREPGIVDVDSSAEDDQTLLVFETDQPKAALSGVSKENVANTLKLALDGLAATVVQEPGEVDPLLVELRVNRAERSATDDLEELYVRGEAGQLVQLGALGRFQEDQVLDKTIYHKNLRRVAYVFGDVAGRPPADAIADMQFDRQPDGSATTPAARIRPADRRTWLSPGGDDPWSIPKGYEVHWAGEGEWKITLDVFRDLGFAFAAALVAIFVILMLETDSLVLPLVIMLAIPLTLIGIMPGFAVLNLIANQQVGGYPNPVFFTATAMIGMIALAGIVVRNSVVLIDFIHHGQAEGLPLREAVIRSAAVRTRPIFLTAGTTLLGSWVITLDPIFSGLAWAIIFGVFTSTLFTLLVVPVVYWLLYGSQQTTDSGQQAAGSGQQAAGSRTQPDT